MRSIVGMLLLALILSVQSVPVFAFEIDRVESPEGIVAWLKEDRANPIITLRFSFAGGSTQDPFELSGRARLVASTLDEGAGELPSKEFQEILTEQSISLRFSAGGERFSGSLTTLTETSEQAFDLLRLALTKPRFDDEAVERMRQRMLASLRSDTRNPNRIASQIWWRANFPDHPYSYPSHGTKETLSALRPEHLRAFWQNVITRQDLKIAVAGDISAAELAPLLDRLFGDLPERGSLKEIATLEIKALGETMIAEVDVPQSVVRFGHGGIDRQDPDWCASVLLDTIMASGFGSRLTQEVREKRGLVYSVGASNFSMDKASILLGSLATRNDRVAESIDLVKKEWRRMADEGPSEAELADAKSYVLGAFPISMTSISDFAGVMLSLQQNDLPIDYLKRREALFEQVSLADMKRVAKRLYRADSLSISVVGKPVGVEATRQAPRLEGFDNNG